jgi:hypothetical protein
MVSIYSIPIHSTGGIARHYYLSKDGDFNNSVGWGPAGVEWRGDVELTQEQLERIRKYAHQFGQYNIYSNNCEMFAWYVVLGKQYSGQTQEVLITQFGAALVSLVQPVHTVRSIEYLQIEQAVTDRLNANLEAAKRARLLKAQAARNDFWSRRDARLTD